MKDEREDGRENGTNGEDRKGEFALRPASKILSTDTGMAVAIDSPPPAHDELDTAE